MGEPKYIVVNGRMVLNPAYQQPDANNTQPSTVANPKQALTCVYGVADASTAADITELPTPATTLQTFVNVQAPQYTSAFGAGAGVEGGQLLDNLSAIFTEYQIPIGLSSKLVELQGFTLHFKIDDSGSMNARCMNGKSRWGNVEERIHILINLLQFVPTGPIIFTFLDRSTKIEIIRAGKAPAQFAAEAHQQIANAFRNAPNGGTPIYSNVFKMLSNSSGKIAHYLFTDGVPNGYGMSEEAREREITDVKNLLIRRRQPQQNPFTFLCCSDNPADTLWMHEIEEIACRPGNPGYVSALQNFLAERTEVLNDQGPQFPYSEAVWLLCNLTAALNPFDLDALDQHAPLTKPTLDSIMGRTLTEAEYHTYFIQHPNAMWIFREDYQLFLTTPIAINIPSVALFDNTLADQLSNDINRGDDLSEARAIGRTEEIVLTQLNRERQPDIRRARSDFWQNHCIAMERLQPQRAQQHLWGDYIAWKGIQPAWGSYTTQPITASQPLYNSDGQPMVTMEQSFESPDYYSGYNSTLGGQQARLQTQNTCCAIL